MINYITNDIYYILYLKIECQQILIYSLNNSKIFDECINCDAQSMQNSVLPIVVRDLY